MTTTKRQNLITAAFFALFALSIWIFTIPASIFHYGNYVQFVLNMFLLFAWEYTVHIRIIQPRLLQTLRVLVLLLALWLAIRLAKYEMVPTGSTAARYLWYGYYIPMLGFPVTVLRATLYLGKQESYKAPGWTLLPYVVSTVLAALVASNDVHTLVFTFPDNGKPWSDAAYGYGPLYHAIFAWFLLCTMATFFHMLRCRRLPGKRTILLLPLLPLLAGLIYHLLYITNHLGAFDDLISAMSFFTVLFLELSIRCSLIRSNANYTDVFEQSSIAAQIIDWGLKPVYSSHQAQGIEENVLEKVLASGSQVVGDKRISSYPIHGSHVVWEDDISELLDMQEELESANEYLEGRNTALNKQYKTSVKRRRLEEQNRLYNEMQNQTAEKLAELECLIESFKRCDTAQEEELLLRISLLCAYLKRRNNLIFLAQENKRFPASELKNCFQETAKTLQEFSLRCNLRMDARTKLSFSRMVFLYDAFETIIEQTVEQRPSYFISMTEQERQLVIGIRIAGLASLPEFDLEGLYIEQEDDEEYLLLVTDKRLQGRDEDEA